MTGKVELPGDGVYPGVPEDVYRAWPLPSYSTIKVLCRRGTPAHYRAAQVAPERESESMDCGAWAHLALLEPDKLDQHKPLPAEITARRGKTWEALQAQHPDVSFYPPSEWEKLSEKLAKARAMREAVLAHPVVGEMFCDRAGKSEVALVWTDPKTGVRCKGRVDRLGKDGDYAVDYKTFTNLDYRSGCPMTEMQIADLPFKWGYHVQVAMYSDAIALLFKRSAPPRFYLALQENEPPFCVLWANAYAAFDLRPTCQQPDDLHPAAFYAAGRAAYRAALRTIAECESSGVWRGYGLESIDLAIPRWADDNEEEV